jgi:hypothetical protein
LRLKERGCAERELGELPTMGLVGKHAMRLVSGATRPSLDADDDVLGFLPLLGAVLLGGVLLLRLRYRDC